MPDASSSRRTPFTLAWIVLTLLAAAASFYSVRNGNEAVRPGFDGSDFRLLWLSGEIWLDGLNPYDTVFADYYARKFGNVPPSHFWVYPPQWFALTAPLSLIDYEAAHRVWTAFCMACFGGAAWLAASAAIEDRRLALMTAALAYSILNLSQMSAYAFSIGQTMPLIAMGVALVLHGMLRQQRAAIIAGLLILSLKPQFGLVIAAIVFAHPQYWRSVAIAGAIGLALLAPPLLIGGAETVTGFLRNLSIYAQSEIEPMLPVNQTGPGQLYYRATGGLISGWLLCAVLLAAAAFVAWASRRRTGGGGELYLWILAIAAAALFAPLHHYDLMIALLAAPLIVGAVLRRGLTLTDMALTGLLILIWRGRNFNDLFGLPARIHEGVFDGSFLLTVLSAGFAAAALTGWIAAVRNAPQTDSLMAPVFARLPKTGLVNVLKYGRRPA